ncbi:heme peroxidase [Mycena galericulata]|nr:heme peroxidase [Mycena galericulata]
MIGTQDPMFALALLTHLALTNGYIWPSPQLDALESARFDQNGFKAHGIVPDVQPCDLFNFDGPGSGRSNAADWIRTAYHDMATHNSTDGTGGLDASIRFIEELERPENVGNGFANTGQVVFFLSNRYVSLSDCIALGAVFAVENCAGPVIDFRGGRVDATVPNSPGVPQPQQDLASHIASFERQGFTPTEMISLVACGHTFGGVQHEPFPEIVPLLNSTNNTESVAHFDSTFVTFDNKIASEFIAGTTQNPLVVGFNDTTNSDKRIFSSDGNVTMRSFANSPELFASTCASMFARMIDTVPKGVQLTDVITPLPVKPGNVALTLQNDTLQLSLLVRLWDTTEDAGSTVELLWKDHTGHTNTSVLPFLGTSSAAGGRFNATWYGLVPEKDSGFVRLDAAAGIKSISFLVDGQLEDQGGVGFAIQDGYAFSATSCGSAFNNSGIVPIPIAARFDVAIRNGVPLTRLYLEQEVTDITQLVSVLETEIPRPAHPPPQNAAFSIWSVNVTAVPGDLPSYTIGAVIGGVAYSTTAEYNMFDFTTC